VCVEEEEVDKEEEVEGRRLFFFFFLVDGEVFAFLFFVVELASFGSSELSLPIAQR